LAGPRRVLSDDAAAEAVVAEVFLALWRQTARYDPACGWPVLTWLLRLVRARALAQLRMAQPKGAALPSGEPRGQGPADRNVRAAPRGGPLSPPQRCDLPEDG